MCARVCACALVSASMWIDGRLTWWKYFGFASARSSSVFFERVIRKYAQPQTHFCTQHCYPFYFCFFYSRIFIFLVYFYRVFILLRINITNTTKKNLILNQRNFFEFSPNIILLSPVVHYMILSYLILLVFSFVFNQLRMFYFGGDKKWIWQT